jgi:hypothetical protein
MTQRRTFSLPDDVAAALDAAAQGNASAYVASALREKARRDADLARIDAAYGRPADPDALDHWRSVLGVPSRSQQPS